MALYLPQHHLAIDIIDDPCSAPVDHEAFPDVDVVRLTCADLNRPEVIAQIAPMRGAGRCGLAAKGSKREGIARVNRAPYSRAGTYC